MQKKKKKKKKDSIHSDNKEEEKSSQRMRPPCVQGQGTAQPLKKEIVAKGIVWVEVCFGLCGLFTPGIRLTVQQSRQREKERERERERERGRL